MKVILITGGVGSGVNIERPGHRSPSHAQKKFPFGGYKHVNSAKAKIRGGADVRYVSKRCGNKGGIL